MPLLTKLTSREEPSGQEHSNGGTHPRLIRYLHIFSSVVRDIFETKFLQEATSDPLSLSQLHLLKLIALNGRHHVGDAADFLGVSAPAATKNIDKLERLGLIRRSPSKGDRRATILSVSRKGRRLVQRYEAIKAERLHPILDQFMPEELDQLASLLERLSVSVVRQEDSGDGLCLRCSAYYDADCPIWHIRNGCPYQKVRRQRAADTESVA